MVDVDGGYGAASSLFVLSMHTDTTSDTRPNGTWMSIDVIVDRSPRNEAILFDLRETSNCGLSVWKLRCGKVNV